MWWGCFETKSLDYFPKPYPRRSILIGFCDYRVEFVWVLKEKGSHP